MKSKKNKKTKKIKRNIPEDYMKCFYSRFGGKCRKAKELIKYFPDHNTFVEPFLGSGAVFLAKNKSQKNILNDLDPLMYNIWRNVKSSGDKFDEKNKSNPFDFTAERSKWDEFLNTFRTGSPVEQIYKSIYIMRNSFNGMGTSFSSKRYSLKQQKRYKILLGPYKEKLKGVVILKKDYKEVIRRYDSIDTFFYLDPPYEIAIKKGGYYEHSDIDLEEMSKLLSNIKGKFLMSLDITPNTKKLFGKFYTKKILFKYATRTNEKEVYEYLIANYKL